MPKVLRRSGCIRYTEKRFVLRPCHPRVRCVHRVRCPGNDRFHDNPLVQGEPHIRFYAGCPLRFDNRRIGTLCIADQTPRTLDGEQVDILRDLARVVEQEVAITLLATRDRLTGLENRRGFLALAQQSLQLSTRQATPVSLLYLNLNDFQRINALHGRQASDDVLVALAERILEVCRDSDVVARLGGDDFVVLLINATREQAEIVVHRIEKAIAHDSRLCSQAMVSRFPSASRPISRSAMKPLSNCWPMERC